MGESKEVATVHDRDGFDIAIIGMAGRFPGARNIEEFWQNLHDGVESITWFSEADLAAAGVAPAVLGDPKYVKAWSVLADAEWFDAGFFGFSPREAEIMDPQRRLFLECAWEALEHAGYDAEQYHGSIGVYGGASMNTYLLHNLQAHGDLLRSEAGLQMIIGNDKDYLTTQVSYKLNLTGPSVAVQTSCSTSLVAVHLACQSLLGGECEMALAGGVTLRVPQTIGYVYQEGHILSGDGHCRAFDAKAQGTVWGSGVGIVVLKRLQDALADGDRIHAVIKGTAINNDGASKIGYTAPSIDGQARMIASALAMAEIAPETVSYIEAHGTGTALGDPIEIAGLTRAFRAHTDKHGFCAIGSVKTNIGHLGAAAGVTGLIKTVLALKHKELPASLHFVQPNPRIDFAHSPFYVQTALSEWRADRAPRRAGVSSFGMGGTNAHVVLEEEPPQEASGDSRPWQLLVLSARTCTALERITTNLLAHFKTTPDLNLADVAYTLQVGRKGFSHRRMLVCRNLDDAVTALARLHPQRVVTNVQEPKERPVTFLFPGQGTQYVRMGFDLYRTELTFREQVDLCSELLRPHLKIDLRDVIYPNAESAETATHLMRQTAITQPALFVIEYALAKLWMAWGVQPEAMLGHSIGEYVAACLAGVFALEDALGLVAARGQLMQHLPGGAMLAVPLSHQEVEPLLGDHLSLAAVNAPFLCVVSGPTDAVEGLESLLTAKGRHCRRLQTSHAFHSEMMEPILEPFAQRVSTVNLHPPQIPYLSNVTGTWITVAEASLHAIGHGISAIRCTSQRGCTSC
jgi:phthiocerol/phenolphthiocerol synthesis type-I polyketide synthase E